MTSDDIKVECIEAQLHIVLGVARGFYDIKQAAENLVANYCCASLSEAPPESVLLVLSDAYTGPGMVDDENEDDDEPSEEVFDSYSTDESMARVVLGMALCDGDLHPDGRVEAQFEDLVGRMASILGTMQVPTYAVPYLMREILHVEVDALLMEDSGGQ